MLYKHMDYRMLYKHMDYQMWFLESTNVVGLGLQ